MYREFFDKVTHNETNINTEIFNEHFKYQNPIFLIKDLFNSNWTKNEKIVNHFNVLIDLKDAVNRKEIPESKNANKVIDIAEEIL